MKILRNCWMSVRYAFQYAPVNAALLVLGYNIPGLFSGLQIVVIQRLVDSGILYAQSGDGFRQMLIYGICLVGMMFSWGVLQKFAGYERTPIEAKLTQKLSPMVMEKMENLEYSVFEDQGAQEVLQRMSREREPVNTLCDVFIYTVMTVQMLVSIGSMLWVYMTISIWTGLGLALLAVPMMFMNYVSAYIVDQVMRDTVGQQKKMSDLKNLLSNKHAIYEMKVFDSYELMEEKWNQYSGEVLQETMKEGKKATVMSGSSQVLGMVYSVFLIITLAWSFLHGTVTLGQFTAAINSAPSLTTKIKNSSWQVARMMEYAKRLDYFRDFLALPERKDRRNVNAVSHKDIAFEGVSFTYPGTDRQVLKHVTFRIKEGERVAFVGENGAGKSTIIKLLCGLYEPDGGRVMIGGVNVRDLSDELRRKLLTVVFQDFGCYEMTLRENAAFGNLQYLHEDERILEAFKEAGCEDLAKEGGLDRNLGHLNADGVDLSKGQWQRLAAARAFLSDASYVILDEPTASLDPMAESRMYENFAQIFHKRGTIMISHRLASARMADRILVLDGGRIVQSGSHAELMEQEGLYRTMYLAQSSWYADKEAGDED